MLFCPSMSLSSHRELSLICGLTQEGFVGSRAVQLLEGRFIYSCSSLAADGKLPDIISGETCCKLMCFVIKFTSARNAQHRRAVSAHKQNGSCEIIRASNNSFGGRRWIGVCQSLSNTTGFK